MGIFSSCKDDRDFIPTREMVEEYLDKNDDKFLSKYIKEYLEKKATKKYIKDNHKDYGFAFVSIGNLENLMELSEDFEICNLDNSLFAIPRSTLKEGEDDIRRHLYYEELHYVKRNPDIKEFLDTHVLIMRKNNER